MLGPMEPLALFETLAGRPGGAVVFRVVMRSRQLWRDGAARLLEGLAWCPVTSVQRWAMGTRVRLLQASQRDLSQLRYLQAALGR